jgi:putative ABC transport system permease protein
MKYLHFVWSNLTRNRARLTFTLISIVSAFALYGMLAAISVFFQGGDRFSDDRVWIQSKYNTPLTLAHVARISALPGIASGEADYGTGTGGFYQNPNNPVGPVAVSRHFSSEVDPTGRFVWKPEEFRQYQDDRTGALVNEFVARLYGWKVGDVIPITVPWLAKVDGTRVWNFTIRGLFHFALIYFALDGLQANSNFLSNTQYAFTFVVSPDVMRQGVLWALLIGILGGLFPALRAGNMPVVRALSES